MRKQLKLSSKTLSMNYFVYTLVWFLSSFCCCFLKCCGCQKEGSWYKRKLLNKKRIDLAVLKLNSELSIQQYLWSKRLAHLAFKTMLTREQRVSTRFFRRYSVHQAEIENSDEEQKKKEFKANRIIENCDFEVKKLDRRILFEMTGERYHEDEFPNETTESEASEEPDINQGSLWSNIVDEAGLDGDGDDDGRFRAQNFLNQGENAGQQDEEKSRGVGQTHEGEQRESLLKRKNVSLNYDIQ